MARTASLLLAAATLVGLGACATCLEKTYTVPEGWRQLDGAPDAASPLRMSIALQQPHMGGLDKLLHAGTRLSLDQAMALRRPDPGHVDKVLRWLASSGISDAQQDRDWIRVRTTVGRAEALLAMKLHRYSFEGKPPVLRTTEYSVPDAISAAVSFVHPIANFMTPEHDVATARPMPPDHGIHGRDESACARTTTPDCILKQYNMTSRTRAGPSPARLAVAGFLDQYANFDDTRAFLQRTSPSLAAAGYNFSVELVNGGRNLQEAAKAGAEANLDIEYAMAIGYPVQVTYFATGGRGRKLNDSGEPYPEETSDNEPYLKLLEYLMDKPDDELPHVLSISYADDELSVPKDYAERVCHLFGALAARGMSAIGGSGDGGARGARSSSCRTNDGTNREVTMATFPGTCPWVTTVGAVTSWQSPPQGAEFSTGGFSQWFARPEWQDAAVGAYVGALAGHLQGYYNASRRALPDISTVGTQFMTLVGGDSMLLDGTSASTPVFAAMIALVDDERLRAGKPSLGWLNKMLYSPEVQSVLVDTTGGRSTSCVFAWGKRPGGWPAAKGWDAITGLGTPGNFGDLLRVLVNMDIEK